MRKLQQINIGCGEPIEFMAPFVYGHVRHPFDQDIFDETHYDEIKIDTGADISVVPAELKERLCLTPQNLYRKDAKLLLDPVMGVKKAKRIWMVKYQLCGDLPTITAPTIFLKRPNILLGIYRALEKYRVTFDWHESEIEFFTK